MNAVSEKAHGSELTVLHLADDPNDSFLLEQELRQQGFEPRIERVLDGDALMAALSDGAHGVIVADLPLAPELSPGIFDEIAARHPQVGVVFRWGESGDRVSEAPADQLGRRIRNVLHLRPDRPHDSAARRRTITELVRHQQAYLDLAREDLWDFEAGIRRITRTMSHLLDVDRVSVWELSSDQGSLCCLDLYERGLDAHRRVLDITSFPTYLESLRRSLTLSTHNAQSDPRTRELAESYLRPLGITAMLDAPIRQGRQVVGVLCHEHIGGERHWGLLDQCAASKVAGLVGRAFEVRERRRLEERLKRVERMEAANEVAAGIAHDMNNMLTVLVSSIEQLGHDTGAAAVNSHAYSEASAAVTGLRQLVRGLANFGRGERLVFAPMDLVGWLVRQAPLWQAAVTQGNRLRWHLGVSRLQVSADAEALSRVVLNLVKNASEHSPGGSDIIVALRTATLSAAPDLRAGPYAILEVQDFGEGMHDDVEARLFQPRFTTKERGEGHGYGLATSFRLVRQHGGTILVENRQGRGCRFQVLLPIAAGYREPPAPRELEA